MGRVQYGIDVLKKQKFSEWGDLYYNLFEGADASKNKLNSKSAPINKDDGKYLKKNQVQKATKIINNDKKPLCSTDEFADKKLNKATNKKEDIGNICNKIFCKKNNHKKIGKSINKITNEFTKIKLDDNQQKNLLVNENNIKQPAIQQVKRLKDIAYNNSKGNKFCERQFLRQPNKFRKSKVNQLGKRKYYGGAKQLAVINEGNKNNNKNEVQLFNYKETQFPALPSNKQLNINNKQQKGDLKNYNQESEQKNKLKKDKKSSTTTNILKSLIINNNINNVANNNCSNSKRDTKMTQPISVSSIVAPPLSNTSNHDSINKLVPPLKLDINAIRKRPQQFNSASQDFVHLPKNNQNQKSNIQSNIQISSNCSNVSTNCCNNTESKVSFSEENPYYLFKAPSSKIIANKTNKFGVIGPSDNTTATTNIVQKK